MRACVLLFAAAIAALFHPPEFSLRPPQARNSVTPGAPADRSIAGGEELVYEVKWWIVKIGTIRMRVTDPGRDGRAGDNGTPAAASTKVRAEIDSYEELPFASLHSVSETVMDPERYSLSSLALTQEGRIWRSIGYPHAPDAGRLLVERGTASGREGSDVRIDSVDTLDVDGRIQDGLSIFYFARTNLFGASETIVPTIVEGRPGRTVFRYPGERGSEEIAAVDYPVDVVGFQGVAEFSGIYGLNGDFEGWFSNDEARVPIRATMGLMVGSVNIELTGWKREGWVPPRAPEH